MRQISYAVSLQVQLGQYFELRDFSKEVRKCRGSLVSASIAVYSEMCQHMLPTPAKYHYIFNLRDVAKVGLGFVELYLIPVSLTGV